MLARVRSSVRWLAPSAMLPRSVPSSQRAALHSTPVTSFSSPLVQHRPADYNRAEAKFEFTAENKQKIEQLLKRYPPNYKRSAVIPLLYLVQEQNSNWVPLAAMNKIAEILDMAPIRVYEVASFYTMFNREPVGKYHLQVCGTTPCQLCGAEEIIAACEKHLGIKLGETTPDQLFTLSEVECLGACANAPMLQISNKEFYENLTPATTVKLLDDLRAGRTPKVGPQNGQKSCEGIMGQTTLKDYNSIKPVCRDLDALKESERKKAEAAKAAAAPKPAAAAPPKP